jgi:hypothetical protein
MAQICHSPVLWLGEPPAVPNIYPYNIPEPLLGSFGFSVLIEFKPAANSTGDRETHTVHVDKFTGIRCAAEVHDFDGGKVHFQPEGSLICNRRSCVISFSL